MYHREGLQRRRREPPEERAEDSATPARGSKVRTRPFPQPEKSRINEKSGEEPPKRAKKKVHKRIAALEN